MSLAVYDFYGSHHCSPILGFLVTKYFKIKTLKKVTVISILGDNMAKIVGSSKITKRYQVTIPDEARKILKISIGDTLAFVEENGRVFVTAKI
jgi:AbrB family looped-hinge helix DNA binding protein